MTFALSDVPLAKQRQLSSRLDDGGMPLPWSGCTIWMGAVDAAGYGRINFGKKFGAQFAHRLAYMLAKGPIPERMTIDHRCRVRCCINPAHLEAVSNRENILRGVGWAATNARRTHCANGHEFTPENTAHAQGGRRCLECTRIRKRRYYQEGKSNGN